VYLSTHLTDLNLYILDTQKIKVLYGMFLNFINIMLEVIYIIYKVKNRQ